MKNRNFSRLLFFLGLGVCPLLMGGMFFFISGQVSTVTCTRLETTHVDCHIERAFWGRIPTESFTVSRVVGTELTTHCDDGCTYGVNLVTSSDEVTALTNLNTSDLDGVAAEQERVDAFLNDTAAPSLTYSSGPTWMGIILSIPFILMGGFIIFIVGIKDILASMVA